MALLLPGCSVTSLRRRAEQIVADVGNHPFVLHSGQEVRVSVSAGLAVDGARKLVGFGA